MFRLVYKNKVVGVSLLESGDPEIGCASGALIEAGGVKALSEWIISEGGAEEDGAFLLEVDSRFNVMRDTIPLPFAEGSVICVPEEGEMYLEIVGVPGPEYAHFFPELVAKVEGEEQSEDQDQSEG